MAAEEDLLFTTTRLTDNVIVFTEQSPWRSHHVVISTDRGLVLVDPGGSPAVARYPESWNVHDSLAEALLALLER